MTKFASAPTDAISPSWISKSKEQRLKELVEATLGTRFEESVTPTRALDNGQVYVSLNKPVNSSERGQLLLELESHYKDIVELGINLWCEPLGDKNSLRNLRGIQVIS
jgi:hypothetical protein